MSDEQQEGARALFRSKEISQLQNSEERSNKLTSAVGDIASSYDLQYTELCHMLEDVVDSVECIKRHRMTNISSLRDDIEKLCNAVNVTRRSATDINSLEKHREELKLLESEKKKLVKEILAGRDEEEDLHNKLRQVEQRITSTRQESDSVKDQNTSEVSSLEYLKKVLHHLSQVYLTSNEKSRTVHGFVTQKDANDVRPFCFDESTPRFEQVNSLWEIITEECC